MRIMLTGSLAFDYQLRARGFFTDYVLLAQDKFLVGSVHVESMRRTHGGNSGNIAYTLALLGMSPLVVATVGRDFEEYRAALERLGVDTSAVVQVDEDFTAACFIATDEANREVHFYYPGAMRHATGLSLRGLTRPDETLVVITPTDAETMLHFVAEARAAGAPYLIDLGRVAPQFESAQLADAVTRAHIVVGNESEFAMIARKLGGHEELLNGQVPLAVVTRGERGSTIYARGEEPLEVPVVEVAEMCDQTGAGDAYLAGLLFGMAHGWPLQASGRMAALMAAYSIQQCGCQSHTFTRAEVAQRYAELFGAMPDDQLNLASPTLHTS